MCLKKWILKKMVLFVLDDVRMRAVHIVCDSLNICGIRSEVIRSNCLIRQARQHGPFRLINLFYIGLVKN